MSTHNLPWQRTHPDFGSFCNIVIEAVMKSWEDYYTTAQYDEKFLWPREFTQCKTDFERVCVLLQFPEVRNFKFQTGLVPLVVSGHLYLAPHKVLLYDQAPQTASAEEALLTALSWRRCFSIKVMGQKDNIRPCNYPKRNRYRLYIRRAECLIELGRVEEAKAELIELQNHLENTPNKRAVNDIIERNLSLCANILNGLYSPSNSDYDLSDHKDYFGELPESKSLQKRRHARKSPPVRSLPFEIIYNGRKLGWGLSATRDIQPG
ncbi:unnamed protein product [Echinostoma caproni]|uniref:TPR_REGION domain-containing protein n=1 Tax=Echinostoma caproni TaxID=27848 RepID=A0A183AXQ9_9TREM|nr:unnamed protein product [Echinostoma caproni]